MTTRETPETDAVIEQTTNWAYIKREQKLGQHARDLERRLGEAEEKMARFREQTALFTRERDATETELTQLRARVAALEAAVRKVPIVERPDPTKGPPFSICLGCGAKDDQPCADYCWVPILERALEEPSQNG